MRSSGVTWHPSILKCVILVLCVLLIPSQIHGEEKETTEDEQDQVVEIDLSGSVDWILRMIPDGLEDNVPTAPPISLSEEPKGDPVDGVACLYHPGTPGDEKRDNAK